MTDTVDELLDNVETGVNDVESEPILDEGAEQIEFEIKAEPVFNQLADKMYESDQAALREGVTNAVTAVKRALNGDHIADGEGVIELRYYEEGNGVLVLRDNGIGMSWREIKEVVSKIGATTSRDEGDLAGQFGMGFLSLFKLVGLDGAFVMHTNSRLTDNEPFSGLWHSGGFNPDTEGKLDNPFDEDEYGVQFEFMLKEDLDADDIGGWIEDLRWTRIPIVYERYRADGTQIRNDELGGRSLATAVPDDTPYAEYEDDYVHAITAPGIEDTTVLLDVPLRRNASRSVWNDAPFGQNNVLVRLKNEKGVVVEGPHKGLMTARPAEYKSMDADRQSAFVRTDRLADDDIVMPGPSGTRDTLERRDDFWEWLAGNLIADYKRRLRDVVTRVSAFDDVLALDTVDFKMFTHVLPSAPEEVDDFEASERPIPRFDPDEYATAYAEVTNQTLARETAARLNLGRLEINRVPRECDDPESVSYHREQLLLDVLYDARGNGRDGEVFMGATMNADRCRVVWDANENNVVIDVDGTEWYPPLKERLGVRKLKKVTKKRLDEFDISDEVAEQFLADSGGSNGTPTPVGETDVTVHFGQDGRNSKTRSKTVSVETVRSACAEAAGTDDPIRWAYNPQRIIAFPRRGDRNLTDYKQWLSSKTVGAMSVTTRQWDHLRDVPCIQHIDDYIDAAADVTFKTSHGSHTVRSAHDEGSLVVHLLPEETVDLFRDEEMMDTVQSLLETEGWAEENYSWNVGDRLGDATVVYAPMTRTELAEIRPLLQTAETYVMANEAAYHYGDPGARLRTPSDAMLYATARLGDWRDTPELNAIEAGLKSMRTPLSDSAAQGGANHDVLALVETLSLLHDDGVPPASQRSE